MDTRIGRIRRRLCRSGWSARERKLTTLGDETIWLISVRRNQQVFSAQGRTPREAWESVWRLARQVQRNLRAPAMILHFPRRFTASR
jgi:hypothetical protein